MRNYFAPRLLMTAAIAWLLVGTWALMNGDNRYLPATRYAGFVLFFDCLILVVFACTCDAGIKEKKWIIAVAAVSGLFSTLLLLDPGFTLFIFPFLVAPWIICKGLLMTIAALALKKGNHKWREYLTGGFLLICFGLLIPHNPIENAHRLNLFVGAIGWTIGLLYVYDAYRLQNINPPYTGSQHGRTAP